MAIGVAQIADIGANSRQPILDNNVFCPIHRLQIYSFTTKKQNPTRGTEKKEVATSMLLQH
jgi:hypothetical protein